MAITSTEKKRRFILFSLLGLAAAVVIVLASFLLFTPEKPSGTSKMASARTEAVSGQAGGVGSEEYNQKLKEHDAQQANAALQSGASFIPTPIGEKKSIVIKKQDTPPSPPPVAQVRTVPVQTPRTDNAMLKRMMDDLAELDTRLASASVGQGQIAYVREFQDETGQQESEKQPASGTPSVAASSRPAVKPGDLLYAIIDVGVNSDVPSAVLATVTSGTYRNARLTGSFQRHDERLVLAFNRIILPSGETIQVESYAVDPTTSEASVASSVDTHFFSRWGGLVASAFLEGLGTAKRYSGAQSTIYGYGNDVTDQMVWNTYSVSDQAWIAAGKVGHPCRRRRVRACGFRLVASVTAYLVTFYQTVSAGIGKADVIAVKIPVPSVPYEKNEWGKLSDRFIGYSTLAEDLRNALHVYLPHFIA